MNRKRLIAVIFFALVILSIPLGVYLVQQQQRIKSRAAGEDVTLLFTSTQDKINPGDTFDLALHASTGNLSLTGVDITIKFDNNKLEAVSFQRQTQFDTTIIPSTGETGINNLSGTINYIAVDKGNLTPHRGDVVLGIITFKALKGGPTEVGFGAFNQQIVASGRKTALNVGKTPYTVKIACPAGQEGSTASGSTGCDVAETTHYRLAESDRPGLTDTVFNDKNGDSWKLYDSATGLLTLPHTLQNVTPGKIKYIYVQYKSKGGQLSAIFSKPIKFVGADPAITAISCGFNSEIGVGSKIEINGRNLGQQGKGTVKIIEGQNTGAVVTITKWSDFIEVESDNSPTLPASPSATLGAATTAADPTCTPRPSCLDLTPPCQPPSGANFCPSAASTPSITQTKLPTQTPVPGDKLTYAGSSNQAVLAASTSNSQIIGKTKDRLEGANKFEVTTSDGRKITAVCSADMTTVTFAAKTRCQPPGNSSSQDIRIQIYEVPGDGNITNIKPIYDSKVSNKHLTLDKDGVPVGFAPKLDVGKKYMLIIKTPKTLAIGKEFDAVEGTTVLEDFDLPLGDIFPLSSPDGAINASDYGELKREWTTTEDVTRSGDFNIDGRVNSVDYSCFRGNVNKMGAKFLLSQ